MSTLEQDIARAKNQGKPGYDAFGDPVRSSADIAIADNVSKAAKLGVVIPGVGERPVTRYTETPPAGSTPPAGTPPAVSSTYGPGGSYDSTIKPYTADEEAAVRAKARTDVQSQIDAVNELMNQELLKAKQIGTNDLGKGRAIGASTGTLGSPIGDKVETDINTNNAERENAIRAANNEKIQSILTGVVSRSDSLIQQRKTTAQTNSDKYISYLKDTATKAKDDMMALADSQHELTSEQRQNLIDQTGYDPTTFDELYKKRKDDAALLTASKNFINIDKPIISADGKTASFVEKKTDPTTGAVSFVTHTTDLPGGVDPKNIDIVSRTDGLYAINKVANKDGTFTTVKLNGGSGGDSNTPYVAGANPVVDSWAQRIQNGTAKITEIPASQAGLRNQVTVALQEMGNSPDGKPTTTELGKASLSTAKSLLAKFDSGKGTSAVGKSGVFDSFGYGLIPGTDRANFVTDFNSLKSQLSLEGVKYLKGQGQVSDAERALLAQAVTKLNLSQSEDEFKSTLQGIIDKLTGNIQDESAGGGSGISVTDPNGTVHNFPDQASADAFKKAAGIK